MEEEPQDGMPLEEEALDNPVQPGEEEQPPAQLKADDGGGGSVTGGGEGPVTLRGVFLGNLNIGFRSEEVIEIFTKPIVPSGIPEDSYKPIPVDRVDLKRGYCFVFLKDVANMVEKEHVERFVSDINGMAVPNVSSSLRAEFAKGDGKVKRKENERRRNIQPSETLFVVNFHEETTKKGDLEMLFGPFGELVRIDMKGNYAFVQFRTVDEAMRAKEATNGGKLDRSVLTVEYVANRRGDQMRSGTRRGQGPGVGGGRDGGGYGGDRRYPDDRGGPSRGPPRGGPPPRNYDDRGRYDDRDRDFRGRGGSRYDDRPRYNRDRSPPGGYRRRSGSRSYSPPPRYDDRDRPRYDRYDDRGGRGGGGWRDRRDRSRSRSRDRGDRRPPSPVGGGRRPPSPVGGGRRPPSPVGGGYRDREPSGDRDMSYRNDRGGERGYRG